LRLLVSAFSAYSPFGSESLVGHHYARFLGRKHDVAFITCAPTDVTTEIPGVQSVRTIDLGGRDFNEVTRASLFSFEARQLPIAAGMMLRGVDLIHRVNPCSIDDPTLLAFFNRPLVIGPILASGDVPESFREVLWREIRHHKSTAAVWRRLQLRSRLSRLLFNPQRRTWTHLKKARAILVGSAQTLDRIPSRFHSKCSPIVYAGVEHGVFTPPAEERSPSEGRVRLLWVGRLSPYKGIELLLRACGRLRSRREFTLTIIGRGTGFYEAFLKDLMARERISDIVTITPVVKREALVEQYRRHDIFCFPTLSDTYGIALLEAMSAGMAVAVSDVGGPREIVPEGAGLRVPARDPDQFVEDYAAGLEHLIADARARREMGLAARARILERHDWTKIGERLEEIYRSLP
jgi:glycosyltransferase involved in cell wall biosynthesis